MTENNMNAEPRRPVLKPEGGGEQKVHHPAAYRDMVRQDTTEVAPSPNTLGTEQDPFSRSKLRLTLDALMRIKARKMQEHAEIGRKIEELARQSERLDNELHVVGVKERACRASLRMFEDMNVSE